MITNWTFTSVTSQRIYTGILARVGAVGWTLIHIWKRNSVEYEAVSNRGSGDSTVVRALASHWCGPDSIPGRGVTYRLSLFFVLVLAPRGYIRVAFGKNKHSSSTWKQRTGECPLLDYYYYYHNNYYHWYRDFIQAASPDRNCSRPYVVIHFITSL